MNATNSSRPTAQRQFDCARSTQPSRDTTCAIIVTYRPDEALTSRLVHLCQHAREAVVVDNGSGSEFGSVLENAQRESGAALIPNQENRGVAVALNQGAQFAISRGYAWALLFDQDSTALPMLIEGARAAYDAFPNQAQIAVIGADHDHPFHFKKRQRFPTGGAYLEMRTVITSGSFANLSIYQQIGGFREDLFIDSVDDEYCMRAREHGYAVIEATVFGISHAIGAPRVVRLFRKPRSTSNHSPARRYYMARNRLVMVRQYLFKDPAWTFLLMKSLLREFFFVVFFEDAKLEKIKASLLGLWDASVGRMGKLDQHRLSGRKHR